MKKFWNKTFIVIALVIVVGVLFCTNFVFAQDDLGVGEVAEEAGIAGEPDPRVVIARIIRIVFGFLGIVAISLVIYGGFLWMTAGGSPERLAKAKKVLINALIGLAIILLAFSITSYIIAQLEEAAGLGPGEFEGPTDGGLPTGVDSCIGFRVTGAMPQGDAVIQNVRPRVAFSEMLDPATVPGSLVITELATGQTATGDYEIISGGRGIKFIPVGECLSPPAPEGANDCLKPDSEYRVVLQQAQIKSQDGESLCCGLNSRCQFNFTPGSLYDADPPNVYITSPFNNQNICDDFFTLSAQANDDSAISIVEFYVDNEFVGVVAPEELTNSFLASLEWEVPLDQVGTHSVYATAYDVDDNQADSAAKNFTIPVAHCCNGILDIEDGETDVDCGGECGGCAGDDCTTSADCAGDFVCLGGVCTSLPTITGLSHEEGAAGNILTIWGSGFGSYVEGVSKLQFTDNDNTATDSMTVDGQTYGLIDAGVACNMAFSWTNTEIKVKVPEEADTGPIKMSNADGLWDHTLNDRGWIGDFVINPEISWPGLCNVVNDQGLPEGAFEDLVIANGENLGASGDVTFGGFQGAVVGTWSDTQITGIRVPNIEQGRAVVNVEVNEELSNPVEFFILPSEKLPEIIEVDPTEGGWEEYVTLKGNNFGNQPIPVFFIAQDGTQIQADTDFPEGCAESMWSDNQAIIKVPQAGEIELGNYNIQMIGAQVTSNQVPFDVIDQEAKPGICGLDPDNGPQGTWVDVYGERFAQTGRFIFNPNIESDISSVTENNFKTQVPPLSTTGPVHYETIDGIQSNEMLFSVGSCTPTSCAEADECCTDGTCRPLGQCVGIGAGESEYVWMFSTGTLPLIPRVIEEQSCELETQSPSPWMNSQDACPNALIEARFNLPMQMAAIGSKLKVEKCKNQDEKCTFTLCDQPLDENSDCIVESLDPQFINTAGDLSKFFVIRQLSGSNLLMNNTWYRVTIFGGEENGILSDDDVPLPKDYVWEFKTRSDQCDVKKVMIEPQTTIIDEYLGRKNLYVYGIAENCNKLDVSQYAWSWELIEQADKATIVATVNEEAEVEGQIETEPDLPVVIQATATVPETGVTLSDTADIIIDFTDPKVIDYGPECTEACINTSIWATFNTAMTSDIVNNFYIASCQGQQCTVLDPIDNINFDIEYIEADKTLLINGKNGYTFPVNTFFRVMISGEAMSTSGINLTGLNFDVNQDGLDDSFSWVFKTKNDETLCDMDTAQVMPENYVSTLKNEIIDYFAIARGVPDECNPNGQILNSYLYNWYWDSSRTDVATISNTQFSTDFPENTCTDNCLNKGSAPTASICGDGNVTGAEECDDGGLCSIDNTACTSNDGCTGDDNFCVPQNKDGCSARCVNENVPSIDEPGIDQGCGDDVLDEFIEYNDGSVYYEECEYSLNPDICTPGCQNSGSFFSGYTCGNANIEPGEDCDDGNKSNGDGCSANCENEGSIYTVDFADQISLCGNGQTEAGEDCDDGNLDNGDGCSNECLAEGSAGTCGNGIEDTGENCDDGNTDSGDGCSSQCLNEGSNQAYDSFCGDGDLDTGESCDAFAAGGFNGSPMQLATVIGNIGQFNMTGSTTITAEALNLNNELKQGDGELTYNKTECESGPANFIGKPEGENICRNTTIQIIVNQPVSASSLGNIKVTYPCPGRQASIMSKIKQFVINKISINLARLSFTDWFYNVKEAILPSARAQEVGEVITVTDEVQYVKIDGSNIKIILYDGTNTFEASVLRPQVTDPVWAAAQSVKVGNIVEITGEVNDKSARKIFIDVKDLKIIDSRTIRKGEVTFTGTIEKKEELSDVSIGLQIRVSEADRPKFDTELVDVIVDQDKVSSSIWSAAQRVRSGIPVNVIGTIIGSVSDKQFYVQASSVTFLRFAPFIPMKPIGTGQCAMPIKDIDLFYNEGTGESTITIYPDGLLESDTTYTVDYSELRDHCNRIFQGEDKTFTFTTGDENRICKLDYVNVMPEKELVTERDYEQLVKAEAKSNDLDAELNPIEGFYDWDWSWGIETDLPNIVLTELLGTPPLLPPANMINLTTSDDNGEVDVIATASVTQTPLDDFGQNIEGRATVTIFLCENVWTGDKITDGIWNEDFFNFKTFYCRDAGDPNITDDDLPNIKIVEAPSYQGNPWVAEDPVVVKEYFMLREDGIVPDAIAMRVYPNLEGVSPGIWYQLHVPNPGQFQELDIDCIEENGNQHCYRAIQDGRTVYIAASNYSPPEGFIISSVLYNNIYVLAYSENSNPETLSIFNQLLQNLKYNTNLGDTFKARTIRDTNRMHDAVFIRSLIKTYLSNNNRLPLVSDVGAFVPGTYVNGQSASTWPSWNVVLGNLLGATLPLDPINSFGPGCFAEDNPAYDAAACQCSIAGYNSVTCYNSDNETFYGSYDKSISHVYDYHLNETKSNYELDINFENTYFSISPETISPTNPNVCALDGIVCH